MAIIAPFRGIRYNLKKVTALGQVTAPPYDVISPEFQQALYDRHPANVIRLILGKVLPGDAPGSDRYSRAAETLTTWLEQGSLIRDIEPSIYFYAQYYEANDRTPRIRKGFMARTRLEEFSSGTIRPHEKTLEGPKADRLKLTAACCANLSPVFSLYSEPEDMRADERIINMLEVAVKDEPLMEVVGDDGVTNKLWRVDDPLVIEKVVGAMGKKSLFIADGHHRYETALNYRRQCIEGLSNISSNPSGGSIEEEPFNYVLMYFSPMDESLDVYPTHRVVHSLAEGFDPEGFIAELTPYFTSEVYAFTRDTEAEVRRDFLKRLGSAVDDETKLGLFVGGMGSYIVLTLKGPEVMDELFGDTIPQVYKRLDVTVLHSVILGKVLGISAKAQEKQTNITYVKDIGEALNLARGDKANLAVIMNPTRVDEVEGVSEAGLLMPQKSTFFFPKLLSGLVINPLWE